MPFLLTFLRTLPVLVLLLAGGKGAWAHAIIRSSLPSAGAIVDGDAVSIRLRFNSRIDHDLSRLTLFAPDGGQRALTPAGDSPADGLDAESKLLPPGAWRLHWQVLSVDGHITRGDIPFTVR
jgi:methionine-rich copper-binding protein CopC